MNHNTSQAIKSLGTGIWFHLQYPDDANSRRTAILAILHASEHLLKAKLRGASTTDLKLENRDILDLKNDLKLAGHEMTISHHRTLKCLHRRKVKIEHSYTPSEEDKALLEFSIAFCLEFLELELDVSLGEVFSGETLRQVQQQIYSQEARRLVAQKRLSRWMKCRWPHGGEEAFGGTYDCPVCDLDFLIMGPDAPNGQPYCFSCLNHVDAHICGSCCKTHLAAKPCCMDAPTKTKMPLPELTIQPPPQAKPSAAKQPNPIFTPAALVFTGAVAGVLLSMILRPRF